MIGIINLEEIVEELFKLGGNKHEITLMPRYAFTLNDQDLLIDTELEFFKQDKRKHIAIHNHPFKLIDFQTANIIDSIIHTSFERDHSTHIRICLENYSKFKFLGRVRSRQVIDTNKVKKITSLTTRILELSRKIFSKIYRIGSLEPIIWDNIFLSDILMEVSKQPSSEALDISFGLWKDVDLHNPKLELSLRKLGMNTEELVQGYIISSTIILDTITRIIIKATNTDVNNNNIIYLLAQQYTNKFPRKSTIEVVQESPQLYLINLKQLLQKLQISKPIIEGYEVGEIIGKGSYKTTYRGKDINTQHDVAVKLIHIPTLAQQTNIQRIIKVRLGDTFNGNLEEALVKIFQEEATLMRKATRARSQNIPQIDSAHYDKKSNNYIIVEELGDETLADVLAKNERINHMTAALYLKQIVEGIEQLHTLGYVHGDLKPENILVNKDNSIRITDFGWSSQIPLLSEHYDDPRYLTNLLTCAPEVFDGKHPDEKSDIWSIGVIAYRMILGEWPFHHGFTGSEEEWRKLSLEQKQQHTKTIKEDIINKSKNQNYYSNIKVPEFDEKYEQYNIDADHFYRSFHYLITFITNILDANPSARILKKNNLIW